MTQPVRIAPLSPRKYQEPPIICQPVSIAPEPCR